MARDAIRVIQEARKSSCLDVTDRIRLHWLAPQPLASALTEHAELVTADVLAIEFVQEPHPYLAAATCVEQLDVWIDTSRG
jgi:isoleucyl-tRNA synthetase